jgi:hypothetical protein
MLAVIIPTVWLTIALLFVALCRMAARGDASAARADARGLDVLPAGATLMAAPSRLRRRDTATPCRARGARPAQAPQRVLHGGRQRP